MYRILVLMLMVAVFFGCKETSKQKTAQKDEPLVSYVNPFIGTGGHGHTYPGAVLPFGMMQLSPDTRLEGWDGCSGYHYSDEYIYGFSHTHLSGTGVSDYGDVLLMPTNAVAFNNGSDGNKGYRSKFSHDDEEASPGYYKVHLEDTGIDVELAVSRRSGIHKYQFPSAENQIIILDLEHRDKLTGASINVVSKTQLSGLRFSKAWATDQKLFFNIQFSRPFEIIDEYTTKPFEKTKIALSFDNPDNAPIYVKVGISAVDEAGAQRNLNTEIGGKDFKTIKTEAEAIWESQLEKITIEDKDEDKKTIFYTSLYHAMLAPHLHQDVDDRYRGMDNAIYKADGFEQYTVFSLWDTYRAAHPLYTIIEQERTNDFIKGFIKKYEHGGTLPIWDLSNNYTGCMIGYHAVPVIADAYMKGIRDYDVGMAFQSMKKSSLEDRLGLASYKTQQFIPVEAEGSSVSKTLEYAYDDWTIAQMAKEMGNNTDYEAYTKRAQYYKNVYDPNSTFMRGRFRNKWVDNFDPYDVNFNYTEANAWQYSFYVPQDISGFMDLLGGKAALDKKLDQLFTAKTETTGADLKDITGLIGQYVHGNEPSHHMAYLYNYVNKPFKTQERVHQILTEQYHNAPDGISGNEDCGQMGAWYVLSSMGFYPVTPASNIYIIGTPHLEKATINLESGKQFTISANNLSEDAMYIESATLNGEALTNSYISHNSILDGGELVFTMTKTPTNWGTAEVDAPVSKIEEHLIVTAPYITEGELAFKEQTQVTLENSDKQASIFYRLGDAEEFKRYSEPITISETSQLTVYAEKENGKSAEITSDFRKINPNLKLDLESDYAERYNAGGDLALIDGVRGANNFKTGLWQGYQNQDLEATLDLGDAEPISTISTGFLQDQRSWIFYPTHISYFGSNDGQNFKMLFTKDMPVKRDDEVSQTQVTFKADSPKKYRYIKIKAKTLGLLPEWHLGYEMKGTSWIFADEILINED